MKKELLLGLSKLLAKEAKGVRGKVRAGEHELDEEILLRVVGTLNVGEDHTYIPTVSMPHKAVLALFVRYCGVTREAALGHLEQAMKDALLKDENAEEMLQAVADLDEAEARVQATLEELPQMVRKGAVTVKELQYAEIKPTQKARKKAA